MNNGGNNEEDRAKPPASMSGKEVKRVCEKPGTQEAVCPSVKK